MEDLNLRKLRLIEFILQEHDEKSITQLEELTVSIAYDEDSKTKIIGFKPNGKAVVKSDFLEQIVKSLQEVADGTFTSLEDLEKESDKWT